MRTFVVACWCGALACAAPLWVKPSGATAAAEIDEPALIEGLRSDDKNIRFAAIKQVAEIEMPSPAMVVPLLDCLRLEINGIREPAGKEKAAPAITSLPPQDGEVSLERLKATPKEFAGNQFVICGAVAPSDFYDFGFRGAQPLR